MVAPVTGNKEIKWMKTNFPNHLLKVKLYFHMETKKISK